MNKPINELKTSALSRRLSIAKTTFTVGKNIAKHNLFNIFADPAHKYDQKQALMSEQARYFATELGKLKGSVVKIGQMLALYGESFLPPEIVAALHSLDNDTAHLDFNSIYSTIRQELGVFCDDFDIDPVPIGTASLAQVHKAVHKSTGQAVVLKVQYPKVAEAIDSDLALFRHLLKITNAVPQTKALDDWFYEIQALLHREVDYDKECAATERFFERLKDDERFVVPKIYKNYCTKRLICMSFEAGVPLTDPSVANLSQVRKNNIGQAALSLILKELFVWREMQTDPNFGNYLLRLNENGKDQIVLLDFGATKEFDDSLILLAKNLFIASFYQDKTQMISVMQTSNYPFFAQMSAEVIESLAEVFLLAAEGFADCQFLESGRCDKDGRYLWNQSDLYNRTLNLAKKRMQSKEFSMPPKELLFISRKFIGAYALLTALSAHTDAKDLSTIYLNT